MHRAEQLLVDRKTGPIKNLFTKYAAVSVTGGVQPTTLRRALGEKHFENGLAARILLAAPPKRRKVWNTGCVDANVTRRVEKVFARLLALNFRTDNNDSPAPIDLPLTIEGQQVWVNFYEEHARLQFEASGNFASALAKIEAMAARLALIVHCARCAADDPNLERLDVVDAASMRSGVTMAKWFTYEVRRAYAVLNETDDQRDQRRLIEWIERKGESVTARDVQQGCRWLRESGAAESALDELVKAGCGRWESSSPGRRGQPTRRFALSTVSTVYGNTLNPEENGNTVDVDSISNVHFRSERQDWETPQELFDELNEEFRFELDVCATSENAKCSRYFTPMVDGLSQDWPTIACWMNPPYGHEIGKWMKKAHQSSQQGSTVVCLVPARTDTQWWHEYAMRGEIRYCKGRLKFSNSKNSAPFRARLSSFAPPVIAMTNGGNYERGGTIDRPDPVGHPVRGPRRSVAVLASISGDA